MQFEIYDWIGDLSEDNAKDIGFLTHSVYYPRNELIAPYCKVTLSQSEFGHLILRLTTLGWNVMIVRNDDGTIKRLFLDRKHFQQR